MKQSFQKLAAAIIYADGDVAISELTQLQNLAINLGIDTNGIAVALQVKPYRLE